VQTPFDVILYLGPAVGFMLPVNRLYAKNLIVNHGGLNEWEREKLSAAEKKYIFINHLLAARYATNNVADNAILQESIKRTFRANSVVIRYGGDHTSIPADDPELQARYPFVREPYFVSVARAQIDNNLHVIIEAFKNLPDRKLVVVSNWFVSEYGRDLFEQNQVIDNILLMLQSMTCGISTIFAAGPLRTFTLILTAALRHRWSRQSVSDCRSSAGTSPQTAKRRTGTPCFLTQKNLCSR
jgi:glycosyltransferase involved in cell wall biosynthesis